MKRKGFAIIVAIFLLIVLSALGIFAAAMLSTDTHILLDSVQSDEAFYLAESGITFYIANQLKTDDDWSDNTTQITKSFAGGTFTVVPLSSTKNSITLESTGSIPVSGNDIKRVIKYTMQSSDPCYDPFRYAVYGGGGPTTGKGEIIISGTSGNIDGDIYLKDESVIVGSSGLNINGVINEYQADADIPDVDWDYWTSIADYAYDGNQYFNKTTLNGIYVINGSVVLDEVNVNGTIVSTNNIVCEGGEEFVVTPQQGHPGFIAGGNITIVPGNEVHFTVHGPMYAANDIIISPGKDFTINGSLVFGDRCVFTNIGPVDINISEYPITQGFIGELRRKISTGGFDEI